MNSYIGINPRVCNGRPVVAGTRIPVTVILDQLSAVKSISELLHLYPELNEDRIIGVLNFCRSVIDHTEFEPGLVAYHDINRRVVQKGRRALAGIKGSSR
jgi:uncharacterized protein (DUF433 family)